MAKDLYRVVTRGTDGKLRTREYPTSETLLKLHMQIGIDDCSTDLALRGQPVFRGLIGPMPEGKNVIRYESPEVFEALTKEWSTPSPRGTRSRPHSRRPSSARASAQLQRAAELEPWQTGAASLDGAAD